MNAALRNIANIYHNGYICEECGQWTSDYQICDDCMSDDEPIMTISQLRKFKRLTKKQQEFVTSHWNNSQNMAYNNQFINLFS